MTGAWDHIEFPYVLVDATYLNGRKDHGVASQAVIVATGLAADGNHEVLELDVGNAEDDVSWTQFSRRLRKRGLHGVVLVISDAHSGLKNAIRKTFSGTAGLAAVPGPFHPQPVSASAQRTRRMIVATVRTIFAQPDPTRPETNYVRSSTSILRTQQRTDGRLARAIIWQLACCLCLQI